MKKIFAVFLIAIMCVTLFACGAGKESQNTGSRTENTTPDDTSKKLSETGEMNFALVSDNGREIAPYKFYYGGQLYGSGNEITYFGTGKLLGFDIKEFIEEIPEVTVKNGFSVRTDKNVEVYNTVSVFDSDGKEIYSGDVSVGNIKPTIQNQQGNNEILYRSKVKNRQKQRNVETFRCFFALYRENILILFNICDIILYCLEFNGLFIRKFVLRRFIK